MDGRTAAADERRGEVGGGEMGDFLWPSSVIADGDYGALHSNLLW